MGYEFSERAADIRRRFEIPVMVAALLVVPVIYVEEQVTDPAWLRVAVVANWLIWLAFFVEYAVMMFVVDDRRAYTRLAWLDVAIVVLTFPVLPALLGSFRLLRVTRLARVARLLRFVRLATVLTRGGSAARAVFRKRGVGYMTVMMVMLAAAFGGLFVMAESDGSSYGDGVWWAVVTLTTVGYGDLYPTTAGGRIVAILLMLLGIGFVAIFTGAVAAYFVEEEESDLRDEVSAMRDQLDRIESALNIASEPVSLDDSAS